jgi:uncharacterized protein YjbJ (UPF0337 family)
MNSDQLEGKWKQLKGSAKQQWGKLTDDDLTSINGKKDVLIGKEDAQARYDQWLKSQNAELEHSHRS